MSVDIQWDTFTSGADGEVLAEKIRSFVHDKFQQIELPRFISSVNVHSFDFGKDCPEIVIKDVCDPLPEFYEDNDEEDEEGDVVDGPTNSEAASVELSQAHLHQLQDRILQSQVRVGTSTAASTIPLHHQKLQNAPHTIDNARVPPRNPGDQLGNPFRGAPGISGGTSNMSYFHLPLGNLSGTQTPLAAVASGTPFSSSSWHNHGTYFPVQHSQSNFPFSKNDAAVGERSTTRPSTANTEPPPVDLASPLSPGSPNILPIKFDATEKGLDEAPYPSFRLESAQPSDLQVVARVKYTGDVRMTLTAEILLDYPMPSFVGIPLKLSITGITFDGVAIFASIKKRAHFCFLSPEDAEALVGADDSAESGAAPQEKSVGGLLHEIRVESEIGRKENGKQVLKNVGKVEKFVLEQVRRIFEEEFVFPSFWTFLV